MTVHLPELNKKKTIIELEAILEEKKKQEKEFIKTGKLEHYGLIPGKYQMIRDYIKDDKVLSSSQKKIVFKTVSCIIETMNKSGMNKFFPDSIKGSFSLLFTIELMMNESYLKLLKEECSK